MATYKLYHWSLQVKVDPYASPESQLADVRLVGYRDNEAQAVITSALAKIEGKTVTTRSGYVYLLQDIDPAYEAWMKSEGITYDPENPIKDLRGLDKKMN
jgi:hypothetical protein